MLREGKGFGFADVILATKLAGFGGLAERFKSVSEAFGFWKTGWLVNRGHLRRQKSLTTRPNHNKIT
jgi:hypothetical protein